MIKALFAIPAVKTVFDAWEKAAGDAKEAAGK